MSYQVLLEKRALKDLQNAVDYYDAESNQAGTNFLNEVSRYFKTLENNPFFQIRYGAVRCLPLKKFPFLLHFSVQKEFVFVHAITHASLGSDNWPYPQ